MEESDTVNDQLNLDLQLPGQKKLRDFEIDVSKYTEVKVLGKGSFGIATLVKDSNGVFYALKHIFNYSDDHQSALLYKNEVENLARFDHPALIGFRGFALIDQDSKSAYILTEYCQKGELQGIIDKESKGLSTLNNTQKFIIIYGIAFGMKILHENNTIHLDIKPENIFLNDEYEPKIADFGLSKKIDKDTLYQSKTVGTPIFMAPEIHSDNKYSYAADVYAFAMLLYVFLTIEYPFSKITQMFQLALKVINGERPDFPIELPFFKELIINCWDQDPNKRPSFKEIVQRLNDYDQIMDEYDLDAGKIDEYIQKLEPKAEVPQRPQKQKSPSKSKPKQLTAIQKLQKAANSGIPDAQIKLAYRLQKGEGVKIDLEKAADYFKKAAESGKVDAMVQYGLCLLEGKGVSHADPVKASQMFLKAIDKNDPTAMYQYALLLLEGNGVEKNYDEAIKYLKQAADQGDTSAQNRYGMILESEKKYKEAVEYYKKSSDYGDNMGMYNYADILEKGEHAEKDEKEAARLYRVCIRRGYVPAMVKYGEMLADGRGGVRDIDEARRLFVHAIQNGYASAYVSLGQLNLNEEKDKDKNEKEATRLFKKAADAGNVRGLIQYAVSLEEGIGVKKDVVKALELYQEAIKKGSIIALTKAARLLLLGEDGIEEDLETAIDYLSTAAENGDKEAQAILDDLNED
ncbi:hypothetical protein M9Y10_021602 [Tritrichomonas musculus]|uniref:Protein kinase domain-containing protein n=1 Tax=Tritrichomonas musculus TaxID=1915356 RepID=A0ABR2KQI6_9EUKA